MVLKMYQIATTVKFLSVLIPLTLHGSTIFCKIPVPTHKKTLVLGRMLLQKVKKVLIGIHMNDKVGYSV